MPKEAPKILNVNVGILGHIDSGKTSLASLDKHPQSAERGITLDLGFSAFTVPLPEHLSELPYDELQFTLVDCPGHASLIKTIIGGAQIIDIMVLVVDVTKGIQTQTAECLVVGEILTQELVVVLNKIDLLEESEREEKIGKMKKKLAATLKTTKFAGCTMVAVSARPGGADGEGAPMNLQALVDHVTTRVGRDVHERRQSKEPLLFSVDHCFPIRGQGTVMTGTVLQGKVSVKDMVEVPDQKLQIKVKSIQMFKRPVQSITRGDRAGICVANFDAKSMERGLVAAPGSVPTLDGAIAAVERVRFFSGAVETKAKFHVTVGHTTVMATLFFFSKAPPKGGAAGAGAVTDGLAALSLSEAAASFSFDDEYVHQTELGVNSLLIGSRLDADIHTNACRIGFHGQLAARVDPGDSAQLEKLKVFKMKSRQGSIDRWVDKYTAIVKNLFKKETDLSLFTGLKVTTDGGDVGTITGAFGKSGKIKVHFPDGVEGGGGGSVTLTFKRYVFDKDKKAMVQD